MRRSGIGNQRTHSEPTGNLDERSVFEREKPQFDLAGQAREEVEQALLGASHPCDGVEEENPHLRKRRVDAA